MRRRADFTAAVRTGRRGSRPLLVVHAVHRPGVSEPPRVGLIVGRAVGGSVVRHRVARRIRALCARQLATLAAGDLLVVRALPAAAGASSRQLGDDLEAAWARASAQVSGAGR